MTRNLKVFGLTLVAALALSAFVASAASATAFSFKSNTDNPTLTGKQHGTNVDVFTTDSGTVRCSEATYVGSQAGTSASSVEVAPTYSGCKLLFFINVTIDPNGCKYRFNTVTKEGANFEGNTDIVCPAGKAIEVTAPGCTITYPAQNGLTKVTFTNLGTGHTQEVTVDVGITTGIQYEEHGGTCENETGLTNNGSLTGPSLFTAENATKEHIGIWVE